MKHAFRKTSTVTEVIWNAKKSSYGFKGAVKRRPVAFTALRGRAGTNRRNVSFLSLFFGDFIDPHYETRNNRLSFFYGDVKMPPYLAKLGV